DASTCRQGRGPLVEGRLPAPARDDRCRADEAWPAEEPPRARAVEAHRAGELHRAAPGVERARRRRDGAGRRRRRVARARGARAVSAGRTAHGGRTVRIGLTGPIGCGKSTVTAWLGELGAVVIDADGVAREVTEPGAPGLAAVADAFGPEIVREDGSLDRAALGRIVFADSEALARLEAIVHPA